MPPPDIVISLPRPALDHRRRRTTASVLATPIRSIVDGRRPLGEIDVVQRPDRSEHAGVGEHGGGRAEPVRDRDSERVAARRADRRRPPRRSVGTPWPVGELGRRVDGLVARARAHGDRPSVGGQRLSGVPADPVRAPGDRPPPVGCGHCCGHPCAAVDGPRLRLDRGEPELGSRRRSRSAGHGTAAPSCHSRSPASRRSPGPRPGRGRADQLGRRAPSRSRSGCWRTSARRCTRGGTPCTW